MHDLPHRKVNIELPLGLRLRGRSRQLNFEILAVAAIDDAFDPLEVSAEVVDQLGMTEIDVQSRRGVPELPQRVA